ncbi:hypothetical protein T492DRAFT_1057303 [Pavlovales sp. CCMP2436]|nr:hypothetical protein T492DRAFT_1057303 [Pavlovales sp. CCMP2436]
MALSFAVARLRFAVALVACSLLLDKAKAHGEHDHDHDHDHRNSDHDHAVLDVDVTNLDALVVSSPHAFLVKLSSKHCESCKEFALTWDKLTHEYSALRFAHVSIDTSNGKALAKQLGALREGIPNLKLYFKVGAEPANVFSGEDAHKIPATLARLLKGLPTGADGHLLKVGAPGEQKGEL